MLIISKLFFLKGKFVKDCKQNFYMVDRKLEIFIRHTIILRLKNITFLIHGRYTKSICVKNFAREN